MEFGQRLRHMRHRKGLTLCQLAARAKVSAGQLSLIERGRTSPTVNKIKQIATALDIPVVSLFGDERPAAQPQRADEGTSIGLTVTRAAARRRFLWPFGGILEALGPVHGRKIEFIYLRYPPGSKVDDPYVHDGEECGLVLEGRFRGIIGAREVVLEAGDSIYFDSRIPHQWENIGEIEVRAIWAITPPSL